MVRPVAGIRPHRGLNRRRSLQAYRKTTHDRTCDFAGLHARLRRRCHRAGADGDGDHRQQSADTELRPGLWNVAGTQAGLAIMLIVLAAGLQTIVTHMGEVFFWAKLAGAAYLIWLGIKLWRSDGRLAEADPEQIVKERSPIRFFWQGFLVIWSNPKALLFFGAFIPQFINPANGSAAVQAVILGAVFMLVATVLDGAYALACGQDRAVVLAVEHPLDRADFRIVPDRRRAVAGAQQAANGT
jgi:threonine/homoserine/homoserine lactone efflux protein